MADNLSIKGRFHFLRRRLRSLFYDNEPSLEEDDERTSSFILRSRSYRRGDSERRIFINLPLPEAKLDSKGRPKEVFKTNKIKTTKYTPLTFLPKNMFEQFRRVANLFFLGMAILQLVPEFAVGTPVFVILPLGSVIFVTAAKDGFEDWKRSQADKLFNSSKTRILTNWINANHPQQVRNPRWHDWLLYPFLLIRNLIFGAPQPSLVESASGLFRPAFETALWQDVRVGDFIYIGKDEPVPADVLLLSTSDPEGECYVETKNLDGETNLKSREAISETCKLQDPQDCAQLQGYVDMDPPSSNLYYTNGSVSLVERPDRTRETSYTDSIDTDVRLSSLPGNPIPFSIKNVLLRGCVLKNTDFAIGLVLFTGGDTKIILNSSPTPSKRSRIEKAMNKQVGFSFFILFALGILTAIGFGVTCKTWAGTPVALLFGIPTGTVFYNAFINFWASLILLQNVIPVSLYVSIEFVKTWQAYFIFNDLEMFYEPTNSVCVPKSWTLSDDLGQVEYVFSDKTGTLTRNVMEFKKCSINGKVYGATIPGQETDVEKGIMRKEGKKPPLMSERKDHERDALFKEYFDSMNAVYKPTYANLDTELITFADPELYRDLLRDGPQSEAIKGFFLNLALCHTVLLEADSPDARISTTGVPELVYRAESPDEKSLVAAARDVGFVFLGKTKNVFHLEVLGTKYDFEQLAQIEFDSTRKRMSVVFQRPAPWNDVVVLCKGADNVILERLAKTQNDLQTTTMSHLKDFSNTGLRTLCLAQKSITREEFTAWNEQYRAALANNLEREYQVGLVCDKLESGLQLMGSTAIEDKLQENVPACIASLRQAGIKVWVLTGDKMETAINIGFGCSLLTKDMKIWTINGGPARAVIENFNHIVEQIGLVDRDEATEHALVVDGSALKHILEKRGATKKLLALAPYFRSVLCCRTSPLQKAQVVRLIKKGQKALTLAIGDGANDVSMIQEAHVGVAIAGEEGLQASMVSDYTISQFRFLGNLLLAHGQFSYHRISEMIMCFFYKNAIWTFAAFWYQFFCGFSSNYFFTYKLIPLYNMIFTVAPVIILGTMDQRLTYDYLMMYPQIYKLGIQGKFFHNRLFWLYLLDGVWQSLVVFFGYYFLYDDTIVLNNGNSSSIYEMSTGVAVLVIILANLFVGFHTRYWTWWVHFWVYASVLFVVGFIAIYSLFEGEFYNVGLRLFLETPVFWLSLPFFLVAAMLPRCLFFYIKVTFFPDDLDLVREIKRVHRLDRRNRTVPLNP